MKTANIEPFAYTGDEIENPDKVVPVNVELEPNKPRVKRWVIYDDSFGYYRTDAPLTDWNAWTRLVPEARYYTTKAGAMTALVDMQNERRTQTQGQSA